MTDLVSRIRDDLARAGDPSRAAGQQAYMKSQMRFRGVRVPEVRRIVGRAVRECPRLETALQLQQVAGALWDAASFREERYAALALCRHPAHRAFINAQMLPFLRRLVETGAWWDLVDECAHLVGTVLATDPDGLAPVMREWSREPDMWLRRVAILCQLDRGSRTDSTLLADVLQPNVGDREFFIRKACGWALRQYARDNPSWVREYLATQPVSALTRREAAKHLAPPA